VSSVVFGASAGFPVATHSRGKQPLVSSVALLLPWRPKWRRPVAGTVFLIDVAGRDFERPFGT
jgi:hypothetical protein